MKAQFTIFLFLIVTIPSFGQNKIEDKRIKSTIIQALNKPLKAVQSISKGQTFTRTSCGMIPMEYGCYNQIYLTLYGLEASSYAGYKDCKSFNKPKISFNQKQKTPELQSTLQEIRF